MTKIKSQTTYRTSDDCDFSDQKEAEAHEKIVVARREFERADQALAVLLAESCRTADGHPFRFGIWKTYYYVHKTGPSYPELASVEFWGRNWDHASGYEGDKFVIWSFRAPVTDKFHSGIPYAINDLYLIESNARDALRAARRQWLDDRHRELDAEEDAEQS
jgi:hypothetical protein